MHSIQNSPWRVIEFYAGIGGLACAACELARASHRALHITAIDIDRDAQAVYQANWMHEYWIREIESLDSVVLKNLNADMWWLSPPCQPYSRRGEQRDIDDQRARSLLHLVDLIEPLQPKVIALENVCGFANSQAHAKLVETLIRLDYAVQSCEVCPTQFGWPNRRPRFYLLARRSDQSPLRSWAPLPHCPANIQQLIRDVEFETKSCEVLPSDVCQFYTAMDRIELDDPQATSACFGSSYGKSLLHAGSYVVQTREPLTLRRFAPLEVARLLGYPTDFVLPTQLSYRRQWKLLGNSLSIPAMKYVLAHIIY